MEGKEEDVKLGANKFNERQPIGTAAQSQDKDYKEPPPSPLFEASELSSWSFYRAGIAEFIATFLFLYITVLTVMGVSKAPNKCASVGIQGIAWAFGGMIFALVYCTAGISGGHINPAVTFGLFLGRKLTVTRAVYYMVMQCLGAICGAGVVKGFEGKRVFTDKGGGLAALLFSLPLQISAHLTLPSPVTTVDGATRPEPISISPCPCFSRLPSIKPELCPLITAEFRVERAEGSGSQ